MHILDTIVDRKKQERGKGRVGKNILLLHVNLEAVQISKCRSPIDIKIAIMDHVPVEQRP